MLLYKFFSREIPLREERPGILFLRVRGQKKEGKAW
jgi:hypothetical protein